MTLLRGMTLLIKLSSLSKTKARLHVSFWHTYYSVCVGDSGKLNSLRVQPSFWPLDSGWRSTSCVRSSQGREGRRCGDCVTVSASQTSCCMRPLLLTGPPSAHHPAQTRLCRNRGSFRLDFRSFLIVSNSKPELSMFHLKLCRVKHCGILLFLTC